MCVPFALSNSEFPMVVFLRFHERDFEHRISDPITGSVSIDLIVSECLFMAEDRYSVFVYGSPMWAPWSCTELVDT